MKFKNQIFLGQFTNPLQHCRHVKYARRIFQSETYELYDCIYKDLGDNDKWWITSTEGSRSASDGNITLSYNSSSYSLFYIYTGTLPPAWADKLVTAIIFDSPFAVEFDIVSISDNTTVGYRVENSSTNAQVMGNYINWGANKHIKIVCNGSKVLYYVDGEKQSRETDYSFTESRFAFRLNYNSNITIKNFKAYPI